MKVVAALLAAALSALAAAGCGDGGAEPGAPDTGATLVLDFQPNAVHAGLYSAAERGYFAEQGLDLDIAEPTGTADGAKLLEAGRADFAILDINDFGLARRRGLDLAAVAAIVQRPLAAVIAEGGGRRVRDLEGGTVGVTGVPSDEAVLRTVLASEGLAPSDVRTETIGFQAAALLAAGTVEAATAFWSAEGVELRQQAVPITEFRVDAYGAPRYPELVVAVSADSVSGPPDPESTVCDFLEGLEQGYDTLTDDPASAVEDLIAQVPEANAGSQRAQLAELAAARAFSPPGSTASTALDRTEVRAWARWAENRGVLPRSEAGTGDVVDGFRFDLIRACAPGEGFPG